MRSAKRSKRQSNNERDDVTAHPEATPGLQGATVTITGGTGSFGSTMAMDLLRKGVDTINIFSRDEAKQDAKTNVQGSYNVIEAAAKAGVRTVVCLSTDKAVYPVNAMGMTKALMDKTAQAFARNNPNSATTVALTRYGNVMYSRGSVIPLFIQQLQAGKPLTLTEPLMTRFLMSLEPSVDLVYHAFFHAAPGDLFVRKAPASTVETLARAVASLLGDEDPEIRVIGSRHGEKLHETLLSREEMVKAEDQGEYFRVPLDARSLQYELFFDEGETRTAGLQDYTSENTERLSVEETKDLLLTIPELAAQFERNMA